MHFKQSVLLLAAAGFAAQVSGASIGAKSGLDLEHISYRNLRLSRRQNRNGGGGGGNNNGNGGGGGQTCLAANAIQTASAETGQDGDVTDGQVESNTDAANFINFCQGQTLTNGEQNQDGSCNGVVMGKIPRKSNMVSSIILSPGPGQVINAGETFDIEVQTRGLAAGAFTNAASTYYSAPQDLDGAGNIIGHCHVTVQDLGGSFTPTQSLDPEKFAFFKGINDNGNGNGLLKATVTGGLQPGFYRVCTMNSAANHQPCLMPVAQRGAQDDCQKFQVVAGNGGGGGGGGGQNENNNDNDENTDANPENDNGGNNGGDGTVGGGGGGGGQNGGGDQAEIPDNNPNNEGGGDASSTSSADASQPTDGNNNGGNNNDGGQDDGQNGGADNNNGGQDGGQNGGGGNNNNNDATSTSAADAGQTDSPDTPDTGNGGNNNNNGGQDGGSQGGDQGNNGDEASITAPPAGGETQAPQSSRTRGGGGRGGRFRNRTRSRNGGQATAAPDINENVVDPSAAPEAPATPTEAPAVSSGADLGNIGGGGGRDLEVSQPPADIPTPTQVEAVDPAATTVATEGPAAPSVTAIPVDSGNLGGEAPPVLESGKKDRPFCVGKNTFANAGAAVQRACDVQFNRCADAANADQLDGKTVQDCEAQKARCGRGGRR